MKKLTILLVAILLMVSLVGCDVTYKVQNDKSVLITLECDEDDVDEFGEMYDFDEGDLDNKSDAEDFLDDIVDDIDDFEGEIEVKSFKRKNDDFIITFKYIPADDIDDAVVYGFAVGDAEEVFNEFADMEYDEDFDDIYDEEMSEEIDDEILYAYDKRGDDLSEKEFENYFDKAKLKKYKAAYIENVDGIVTVPGTIKMVISPSEDIEIEGREIEADNDVLILYASSSLAPLVILCVLLALVGAGLALYFLVIKKDDEDEDTVDEDFEVNIAE